MFPPVGATNEMEDVSASVFDIMASQGGVVGAVGLALGALFGVKGRKKERATARALDALAEGTADIIENISDVKGDNGLSYSTYSQSDAIRAVQSGVKEALAAQIPCGGGLARLAKKARQ